MQKATDNYSKSSNAKSSTDELSRAGHKIVHDLHELKNDAQTLKADLKDATHKAGDVARNTGAQVKSAAHTVINAPNSFAHKVRSKPIQSSLIALAVGFVAGRLYRR